MRAPDPGEALLETLYVSVDPAMRVWMDENPGYQPPVPLGSVMRAGGVARVLESRAQGLGAGDLVSGRIGWQSHPTLAADGLERLDERLGTPQDWLHALGNPGLTAWVGLFEVAALQPGETVLVSAAAGAVGQMVVQIARAEGCRVVGLAGGPEKCAFLRNELGIEAAIDHRSVAGDGSVALAGVMQAALAGRGADVYFDNVGGAVLDAALASMAQAGRVVICGRISQTATETRYGITNLGLCIGRRLTLRGFLVSDHRDHWPAARTWIAERLKDGRIRSRVHLLHGLERAPDGLALLFAGGNIGKLAVRVAS